jgi:6,7-dimethyl-8-ribityllumazine synthase
VAEEIRPRLTTLGLTGQCIGNGILTVENEEQARVRAEAAGQDKGGARRRRRSTSSALAPLPPEKRAWASSRAAWGAA